MDYKKYVKLLTPSDDYRFRGGQYLVFTFYNDQNEIIIFSDHSNNAGMSVTNCIEHLIGLEMHQPKRSDNVYFFEMSDSTLDFISSLSPDWHYIADVEPHQTPEYYLPFIEEYILGLKLKGYKGITGA